MSEQVPTISQVTVYPVKSLRGLALAAAHVEHRGLRHDRRWALADDSGNVLTQRGLPHMALIGQNVSDDRLSFTAPGTEPLSVPIHPPPAAAGFDVRVGGSLCQAIHVGQAADAWFSTFLGLSCRLGAMSETERRAVGPDFVAGEGIVSFADCYPLLLIGEASLSDLNSRLNTPVPMDRFRPSLVARGADAFAEDRWSLIRIGRAIFRLGRACGRCVLTAVDQATGERRGPEPLRTLVSYRLQDQRVLFGQYLIPLELGEVRVGDAVEVLEVRP